LNIFVFRAASESIQLDYILYSSGPAKKEIAIGVHGKAPGDKQLNGLGPAFGKNADVTNGVFERVTPGVNRAENDLVFQNEIPHHQVGVDFDGAFPAGHAGEDKDAIGAEILDHFKRQASTPRRFV